MWRPVVYQLTEAYHRHMTSVNLVATGSGNDLIYVRHQATTWANADFLLMGPLETNFKEIWNKNNKLYFQGSAFKNFICTMTTLLLRFFRWVLHQAMHFVNTMSFVVSGKCEIFPCLLMHQNKYLQYQELGRTYVGYIARPGEFIIHGMVSKQIPAISADLRVISLIYRLMSGLYSFIYIPDSKAHGANMGPIWGRQDPGGPHVCAMNLLSGTIMHAIPFYSSLLKELPKLLCSMKALQIDYFAHVNTWNYRYSCRS